MLSITCFLRIALFFFLKKKSAIFPLTVFWVRLANGIHVKRYIHLATFSDGCQRLHLEILVSPLVKRGIVRRLEVQWEYAPNNPGDWIGLFRSDPLENTSGKGYLAPIEKVHVTRVHGWANTSIFEEHVEPENLGFHVRNVLLFVGSM